MEWDNKTMERVRAAFYDTENQQKDIVWERLEAGLIRVMDVAWDIFEEERTRDFPEEQKELDQDLPRYEADLSRDNFLGFWSARVWFVGEDGVRSYVGSPVGMFGDQERILEACKRLARLHRDGGTVRLEL